MKSLRPQYKPAEGKTYTLFGESDSTAGYYKTIAILADKVLALNNDTRSLIENIRVFSSKKRILKKSLAEKENGDLMSVIINLIDPHLKKYTENTPKHLETLPLSKYWDRRLATTREQYHLYMIEIELTNRLFISDFIKADKKIALMPYCLQDFTVNCKSERNGFDHQCRHCSAMCFQNWASEILKNHQIDPYIWMEGNMKRLAKFTRQEKKTFGVLGIACVPELVWGMRNCHKNNIPVVGIPLNANRCIRWFGEFFPNSIDISELEKLLASGS